MCCWHHRFNVCQRKSVNVSCELNNEIMITAEEFFRKKIKEQNPDREVVTLNQELITAEQGMRWAHEFKQLHLHSVSNSIATEYAEFCVRCDREKLPLLCLEDYIKQYCC